MVQCSMFAQFSATRGFQLNDRDRNSDGYDNSVFRAETIVTNSKDFSRRPTARNCSGPTRTGQVCFCGNSL